MLKKVQDVSSKLLMLKLDRKLGIPAAFGAPVMLPPTDYRCITGALQIAKTKRKY